MAFYTGIRISEQASPVFWQVGAPRSPFGKFWTRDGHSMIRVDEISEQGSVSTSEVGDFCKGILQRDFCICGFLFALFNKTFFCTFLALFLHFSFALFICTFCLHFLFALFNETFLHFSCTFQNKVLILH